MLGVLADTKGAKVVLARVARVRISGRSFWKVIVPKRYLGVLVDVGGVRSGLGEAVGRVTYLSPFGVPWLSSTAKSVWLLTRRVFASCGWMAVKFSNLGGYGTGSV